MTRDALNWIQEEVPWRVLLKERDCVPETIDVPATKVAVGYTGIAARRAQNVQMMWDRCSLHTNRRHWRRRSRQPRQSILCYLNADEKAWCQFYEDKTREDERHVLGWCDNEAYREIGAKWYGAVQREARELAPALPRWRLIGSCFDVNAAPTYR